MKKTIAFTALFIGLLTSAAPQTFAKGFGTSSGISVLEPISARASSLGDAYSSITGDVAAMFYNPASIGLLNSHQAMFSYQPGLLDDAFSQLALGFLTPKGVLGVSASHYNGGSITLENGQSVKAQTDIGASVSYSQQVGVVSLGISLKYLSSTLIERATARAYAVDLGFNTPISSRVRWGMSALNFGSKLTYISKAEDLPRMFRSGLAISVLPGRPYTTSLLLDANYHLNEQELSPGLGVETRYGPLAVRGGYRQEQDRGRFTVGTGLAWGPTSFDYGLSLTDIEARNQISLSLAFGSGK